MADLTNAMNGGQSAMEKNKVESRTEPMSDGLYKVRFGDNTIGEAWFSTRKSLWTTPDGARGVVVKDWSDKLASRPSVHVQNELHKMVCQLFPDTPNTSAEDHLVVLGHELKKLLAVSRSEVATPQSPQCISTNCPVWEFTHDIDAKGCISYRPGAPAAGLMPSCTVCGEIMQGVCKCGSKTGASRAAGSTERWDDVARVGRQMANMMFNLSQLRERVLNETDRLKMLALQREWDEMLSRAALAQTDTDGKKGN